MAPFLPLIAHLEPMHRELCGILSQIPDKDMSGHTAWSSGRCDHLFLLSGCWWRLSQWKLWQQQKLMSWVCFCCLWWNSMRRKIRNCFLHRNYVEYKSMYFIPSCTILFPSCHYWLVISSVFELIFWNLPVRIIGRSFCTGWTWKWNNEVSLGYHLKQDPEVEEVIDVIDYWMVFITTFPWESISWNTTCEKQSGCYIAGHKSQELGLSSWTRN